LNETLAGIVVLASVEVDTLEDGRRSGIHGGGLRWINSRQRSKA
jgi:hypothetical protein